jgi:hypothetical protein
MVPAVPVNEVLQFVSEGEAWSYVQFVQSTILFDSGIESGNLWFTFNNIFL